MNRLPRETGMRNPLPFVITVLCLLVGLAWAQEPEAQAMLAQARAAWEREAFDEAATRYRDLRDRAPEDAFVRAGEAQFWLQASLARAGRLEESIAETRVFLEKHPTHRSCDYALYFLGLHLRELGRTEEARAAWTKVIQEHPNGGMVEHARAALEGGVSGGRTTPAPRPREWTEAAEGAGRWLARLAEARGEGVVWPEYEGTRARKVGFYEGAAGIGLFFLNLHRVTGKPEYRDLARNAGRGLLDRAERTESGTSWREEHESDDGKVSALQPSPALYVGAGGIGWFFLALHADTGERSWLDAARGAADGILAAARKEGAAWSWGDDTDIISGPAGFGLFLLDLHRATGDGRYLDGAARAADGLLKVGVKDGDGMKWKSSASLDRFYTGASHGTAGIADFLLRVHKATREARYLQAAEAGARWLLRSAVPDGEGSKWCHYQPGAVDRFQTGWCHGPAGTGRFFLDLHEVTGRREHLDAAVRGGRWLMSEVAAGSPEPRFYGLSMCCGAAGVGDFLLDLHRAVGDGRVLEAAAQVGRHLAAKAHADGDGFKWTNAEHPDGEGKTWFGTGYMTGAAGVGSFLLRLDATMRGMGDRFLVFADKTAIGDPPAAETAEYVVATDRAEADPAYAAVRRLAEHRKGTIVRFRPGEWASLQARLAALRPRHVAFVLPPEVIDLNLHRSILALACRLDADPFVDFAFGYVTGDTPQRMIEMVEHGIRVEAEGLPRTWNEGSVVSQTGSFVSAAAGPPAARSRGFTGRDIHWACVEDDPDVRNFVRKHLPLLAGRGVMSLSGNGDPEGIWLFHDQRNVDREKHWAFDPAKIGHDPDGTMPRITAEAFRGLDLAGAVVWSGTCHSGVLSRAFIEGDIVSTFGRVDRQTEYRVPAERSLARAILACGPVAFLAPIGPNHGYSCLVEQNRAVATGESLGEVMRGRYNEIVLVEGLPLSPEIYRPGEPEFHEDPMRGGGVNRVLYGDPALRPFPAGGRTPFAPVVVREGDGLRITCTVAEEDAFEGWDMFGGDREHPERVRVAVPVPEGFVPAVESVAAAARGRDGKAIPLARTCMAALEQIDGRQVLHLQAGAGRGELSTAGIVVEFRVKPRSATPD